VTEQPHGERSKNGRSRFSEAKSDREQAEMLVDGKLYQHLSHSSMSLFRLLFTSAEPQECLIPCPDKHPQCCGHRFETPKRRR